MADSNTLRDAGGEGADPRSFLQADPASQDVS